MRRNRRAGAARADPWREVLERHIAEPTPGATPPTRGERKAGARGVSVRLGVVGVALLAVLATAAAFTGYLAKENFERADRWRDRATSVQELLDGRTNALNRQTARLNRAATRLREARRAIARSEDDVAQLTARQRALAAEKAEVEDQRAELERRSGALIDVANGIAGCRNALASLVEVFSQGLTPADADFAFALSTCDEADAAIGSYEAAFGGGE